MQQFSGYLFAFEYTGETFKHFHEIKIKKLEVLSIFANGGFCLVPSHPSTRLPQRNAFERRFPC